MALPGPDGGGVSAVRVVLASADTSQYRTSQYRNWTAKAPLSPALCWLDASLARWTALMPLSRSEQMSRIRGKNTSPEVRLRKALWAAGRRYRLHYKTPAGRPDVVFPGARVAVFIDGCFWHGCPVHYVRPRSREAFWAAKLRTNVDRDRAQTLKLEDAGWRVVRVWEHEVYEHLEAVVARIVAALDADSWAGEPSERVVKVEAIDDAANTERRFLEALRDPGLQRRVEGRRYTTKWRRPAK